MTEPKKPLDDAAGRVALATGRRAVKRAVDDLLATDEERAAREAERASAAKRTRTKWIVVSVVVVLLVLGVVGMVVSYWPWFLLAGAIGLVGLLGWYRVRRRFANAASDGEVAASEASSEHMPEAPAIPGAMRRAERRRDRDAPPDARASEAQEIEQELAALKAKHRK